MRTALVAHWPAGIAKSGVTTQSLVSVIDLAPTILDVAGITLAETMQGVSLKPVLTDASAKVRRFAFSEHNWHDYEAHGRSVRADGFLYIRNNRPYQAWQGPADSVRSISHQQLLALRDSNKLSEAQADVFLAPRPAEELYQYQKDPHQMHNLADDPAQAETLAALRAKLDAWMSQQGDQGQITEMEALDHLSRNRQKAENAGKSGKKGGKKRPTQQG